MYHSPECPRCFECHHCPAYGPIAPVVCLYPHTGPPLLSFRIRVDHLYPDLCHLCDPNRYHEVSVIRVINVIRRGCYPLTFKSCSSN